MSKHCFAREETGCDDGDVMMFVVFTWFCFDDNDDVNMIGAVCQDQESEGAFQYDLWESNHD